MVWRWLLGLVVAGLVALGLTLGAGLPAAAPIPAPGAQATPVPTATATPTLPPLQAYGAAWGVQALPEAGMNCLIDTGGALGGRFSCVAGTPVVPPPGPDLTTGLAHYWPLAGASDLADTVGGLDLTAQGGTVGSGTLSGVDAVAFPDDATVTLASSGTITLGAHTSIVVAAWVQLNTFAPFTIRNVLAWTTAERAHDPLYLYLFAYPPDDWGATFIILSEGDELTNNANVPVPADALTSPHLLVGYYDVATATVRTSLDGGAWVAFSTPGLVMDPASVAVWLGNDAYPEPPFDGLINRVGIWFDVLPDAAWLAALWNAGNGWAGP